MKARGGLGGVITAATLLGLALVLMPRSEGLFHWAFPKLERPLYTRIGFAELTGWHILLVGTSTAAATLLGVGVAFLVTREAGLRTKPLVLAIAAVSQTFPPVAVLVIATPILGFGGAPTSLALFAYALLPIVLNAVTGFENVGADVIVTADGMGMTLRQRLLRIEFPLAFPAILAGVRTATIINVGTATVGSTAGAFTLGSPILDGLSAYNTAYVLQGAVLVALLAVLVDQAFEAVAHWQRPRG